jgi:hypothetical protein
MAILLDRGRHARKKDQQNDRNFKRNGPLGEHGYYVVTRWRTVALSHMVASFNIDPPKSGSRKKRAS